MIETVTACGGNKYQAVFTDQNPLCALIDTDLRYKHKGLDVCLITGVHCKRVLFSGAGNKKYDGQ